MQVYNFKNFQRIFCSFLNFHCPDILEMVTEVNSADMGARLLGSKPRSGTYLASAGANYFISLCLGSHL